jgi:hypothetical protein
MYDKLKQKKDITNQIVKVKIFKVILHSTKHS